MMNVDSELNERAKRAGFKWGISNGGDGKFYCTITCMGVDAIQRAHRHGISGMTCTSEISAVVWTETALRTLLA